MIRQLSDYRENWTVEYLRSF
ncbi:hypothetical protein HOE425_240008 [Hoeflea sp. EC-HK425]|nr:hypothetical protein HOE425_240008 [Hoeflea sp. EC-HK425]